MGIVYIDEVRGLGVQHAEGTVATVPPQGGIDFDTTNVLFICGGAFVGLEEYHRQAAGSGFSWLKNNQEAADGLLLRQVKPEDLQAFGLIPEIIEWPWCPRRR